MSKQQIVQDLSALAAVINRAHADTQASIAGVQQHARAALIRANDAGRAMLEAKRLLPHGSFGVWLEANCVGIKRSMATVYMRIAMHWEEVGLQANSIRGALSLIEQPEDAKQSEARSWSPGIEVIKRATTFRRYIADHPISELPDESRDVLRQEMHPIAAQLWPDRFNN